MQITRAGSRPSQTPSLEYFTGRVRMDPIGAAEEPGRHRILRVTFEPGARTNWHTHPYGQTIHVVSGLCLAQVEGEAIEELRPGDTAWFPADVRHWHGAAPEVAMVHIAVQEARDGATADWAEPVSEADYSGPRAGGS
ncbi:cupin domain-containing protein [Roseivivax sp. GX 12232]|uniref:(R)-mandelonitrile lyase n=1 Tax=Roseivivax sp. GX 12232 TaxID=2900547 RepID=UPI001E2F0B43|nr:cupin domain-containing protein [Roseivivax sp. GX 12232]MCE0505130.1 cupin domain-containing protein [Roseivivax sp. GX 12232]